MKTLKLFLISIFFLYIQPSFAELNFVQITDPHLFETPERENEAKDSLRYFNLAVERINKFNQDHSLNFVLLTGDLGLEKLVNKIPISQSDAKEKKESLIINEDGKFFTLEKNEKKWKLAVDSVSKVISRSNTKLWLLVPGNNDLFDELPETITLFRDFVHDIKFHANVDKAGINVVDFRLESNDRVDNFAPGTLIIGDDLFIGWDNSFFKNNYSVKRFLDKHNRLKPIKELAEYKSLKKLQETLNASKVKFAYIFYHIPEVDDPWRVNFKSDPEDPNDNTVSKTIMEARKLSPEFAKNLYPYSAWMVPIEIRRMWEDIIMDVNRKTEVKGLFCGHFHDHRRAIYENFDWLRDPRYNAEILSIMHVSPSISVKNQAQYAPKDRSRGGQYAYINDEGDIKVKHFWIQEIVK